MSEHTSAHSAEHEDDDDQELVPASGGSLAGRGHRPVRYRPSTGYLPWLLTMCDRELARHMTRLLAELDLTEAQYGVLQALVHLRRASSATLARSVSVTPQAMVGLVAALERKGYITREFGRGAGRVIDAEVTARGKEAYEAAKRRVRALDRSLRRSYTDEEFDQLVGLLERLPGVLGRLDDQRGSRRRGVDD
ncbi:MarR family winged helix-turn-helix transcriptional regulator [Catenulispora yoronensis]|uniref:MarR family winged helix-turn-helix transcriptional regulator n=1 Tax=Catenulispora yoronensis TaxID=450799 RepID=UPI0031CF9D0A